MLASLVPGVDEVARLGYFDSETQVACQLVPERYLRDNADEMPMRDGVYMREHAWQRCQFANVACS